MAIGNKSVFKARTYITCGICGKPVLVFLEQPGSDVLKQVGNDEISGHIMDHWLKNEVEVVQGEHGDEINFALIPIKKKDGRIII